MLVFLLVSTTVVVFFIPGADIWAIGLVKRQKARRLMMFGGFLLFLGVSGGFHNHPIRYIFKQKNMEARYTGTELHNHSQVPGRLDLTTWHRLRHLHVLTPRYCPTVRGSGGGSLKPKRITSSPPQTAVPFLPGHIAGKQIPSIHTEAVSRQNTVVALTPPTWLLYQGHLSLVVPISKWQSSAFVNANIQGALAAKLTIIIIIIITIIIIIIITSLFNEGIAYTMYIQWRYSCACICCNLTEQCSCTVGPS